METGVGAGAVAFGEGKGLWRKPALTVLTTSDRKDIGGSSLSQLDDWDHKDRKTLPLHPQTQ